MTAVAVDQGEHNRRCIQRALDARRADPANVATWNPDRQTYLVPSRSGRGVHAVAVRAIDRHLLIHCDCAAEGRWGGLVNCTPCWHGAAACITAAVDDLVVFDGDHWHMTLLGAELAQQQLAALEPPADPFAGLPT